MSTALQAAGVHDPAAEEGCPFYGHTLIYNVMVGRENTLVFRLWGSRGNHCALSGSSRRCELVSLEHKPIWGKCPLRPLPHWLRWDPEMRTLTVMLRSDTTEQG